MLRIVTEWRTLSVIVPPHTQHFGLGGTLALPVYLDRLRDHLNAAEQIGMNGAFIFDFPVAMDPWLAAFDVLTNSVRLQPIVAVRPHHESAEAVARRLVDLAYRFGRQTHVNIVAGATRASRPTHTDGSLEDKVATRQRLARFSADLHAEIGRRAAQGTPRPLVATPASSTSGRVAADIVLMMARPRQALAKEIAQVRAEQGVERIGMLVGLVVRATDDAAWAAAAELHPRDRRQAVAGRMFMSQVMSSEHKANYALGERQDVQDERLWYGSPTHGIDAPKLVGATDVIRDWLASCADLGVTDLIIDLPPSAAEFVHMGPVFAAEQA